MKKVACLGILVADVIVEPVCKYPENGVLEKVNSITVHNGGNAMTASININKLGVESSIIGMVGNDMFGEFLKKKLQEKAAETDLSVMKDRVLEQLYEKNEIEVPAVMIANEIENMLYDMDRSLSAQGLGLKQYLEWTGKTVDELREETRPDAEKRIRTRVLLKNVIRMENLDVEDEEIRELMEDFGKQYGMDVEQVKEMAGSETENYFREDAQTKKAIDWLFDNAKQVAPKAE